MEKQLYFEDVEIGAELLSLEKKPTTRTLVKWAGVSDEYAEIHYDVSVAKALGMPGIIIHGSLAIAWLGQLLSDWMGEGGQLRKLSCSHRGMDIPGDTITCKGKVTNKYMGNGSHYVECEIWTENTAGQRNNRGRAIVALPSRG